MFFIFDTKQTFNKLRQVFIKTLIQNYFDPKYYIYINQIFLSVKKVMCNVVLVF